jgi:hypothetical protein
VVNKSGEEEPQTEEAAELTGGDISRCPIRQIAEINPRQIKRFQPGLFVCDQGPAANRDLGRDVHHDSDHLVLLHGLER